MKVITVSGYKSTELGIYNENHEGIRYIKKIIKQHIASFIDNGLEWVIISGQLGVELWTAEVVFELQHDFPQLKIAIFTPYLLQEENWNELNKEKYQKIISNVNHLDSITKKKYEAPYQLALKNQFLIDKSDGLLLLYDEEKEGTPKYLLQEARKKEKNSTFNIYLINFQDVQDIVDEELYWES